MGRTNNPKRRSIEHRNDPKKQDLEPLEVKFTNLTPNEARVMEQVLISSYSLEALKNRRREIAVKNVSKYTKYLNTVARLFAGFYESEYLCLIGR